MGSNCKQHGQPSTSWLCPSGSGCDLHSASRPKRASVNSENTCLMPPCRSETTVKLTLPTGHNPAGFPRLKWFCLEDDDYRPQLPDAQGVLHSRVFPGLRLPVAPLLAGDTAKVLAALTGHEPLNKKPPETSVNSED